MTKRNRSESEASETGADKYKPPMPSSGRNQPGEQEGVTDASLAASVDAPVPEGPAPTANGRKPKDTSNPPYYLLTGDSAVPNVPNLHQTFATIGQFRKWWQGSKGLVNAVYGRLALIRCKAIASGDAGLSALTATPEPAATPNQPVQ